MCIYLMLTKAIHTAELLWTCIWPITVPFSKVGVDVLQNNDELITCNKSRPQVHKCCNQIKAMIMPKKIEKYRSWIRIERNCLKGSA